MAETYQLRRLEADEERPPFDCGDPDLNEFFKVDSVEGGEHLMTVTYVAENDTGEALAFFSVSNDAVRPDDTSKSRYKKNTARYPSGKALQEYALG